MREYKFGPDMIVAVIIQNLQESLGASCEMEQIGTKQVPIFRMKCDTEEKGGGA